MNAAPRIIRYGVDEPLPEQRCLFVGPLSVVLEQGMLRYIKFGQIEVIRAIYVAVRDKNWDTIPPEFVTQELIQSQDDFTVKYTVRHRSTEIDFVWRGFIEGRADGTIRFTMSGAAQKDGLKSRIGFCVLYPAQLAGRPVQVETVTGRVVDQFPDRIAPHQPFSDIISIRHSPCDTIFAEVVFGGDLFEMEDQRNWTDASYKVYSTPLKLPYPVLMHRGDTVEQSVELRVSGEPTGPVLRETPIEVSVDMQSLGTLPDLGVSWSETTQFNKREILALEALHLQYLFVEGTPSELNRGRLRRVSEMANALHTYIDAAVIVQDDDNGLNSLFNFIAKNEIPVVRLRLFPAQGFVTNRNILETAQSLLSEKGMSCQLGGGSRAYFAQFNRASLPLELMDFTTFSVTPQVHMFDNVSVMETIQCQYQVVSDARRISKGRSVVVGPITLRSHFDSNAAATVVPPFDARQKSLFAAAWLVGSIQSLTAAGASAANYFELTGREGVMDDGGAVKFPVYYVLKTIGDFSASTIFGTRTSHPQRLAALGMAKGFNRRVMVANLTNNLQIARIRMPEQVCANISVLDETTYLLTHRRSRWIKAPKTQDTRDVSLALLPYAIAHVDWVSKD